MIDFPPAVIRIIQRIIDWVGLVIMGLFLFTGIAQIALFYHNGWYDALITHVSYPFVWGQYAPYAWQVILFTLVYFYYHKNFKWLSPFMFAFIWGLNDIFYNISNDLFHLDGFLNGSLLPDGPWVYAMKMGVEITIAIIAALVLRPRISLQFNRSYMQYMGLTLVVAIEIWAGLTGAPILQGDNSSIPLLQLRAFAGLLGFLMLTYNTIWTTKIGPKPSPKGGTIFE